MITLIEKLRKPLNVADLDEMRLCDIMKLRRRICDGNIIINLDDDIVRREHQLRELIVKRIKALIGWSGQVDVSTLSIENTGLISIIPIEFNKTVGDYIVENKIYREGSTWSTDSAYNVIRDTLVYSYQSNPCNNDDTLESVVKSVIKDIARAQRTFDNLRLVINDYKWAIPVVDYIRVGTTGNDIYDASAWEVINFGITPEMVNGFMEEAGTILQDPEAVTAWRSQIINSFRTASYGSKVDFNSPKITVKTPEGWKKEYYEKIKPEAERRERCKDIIGEIKGPVDNEVTTQTILSRMGIAEFVEKCRIMAIEQGLKGILP